MQLSGTIRLHHNGKSFTVQIPASQPRDILPQDRRALVALFYELGLQEALPPLEERTNQR